MNLSSCDRKHNSYQNKYTTKDVYKRQVMNTAEMHTIEHLAATFLRNHAVYGSKTIYFGPMGCQMCIRDSPHLRLH